MASVSGSKLAFLSSNEQLVNLILNDGKTTSGSTIPGSFNIEIFTSGTGTALPGVDATATIAGAVKISNDEVQAAKLGSTEQLGAGTFTLVDETGGENIKFGTGAQTIIGSSGDTIVGGNVGGIRQVADLTGTNTKVTAGPMTVSGGAGPLLVAAGSRDSIVGGSGPITVSGSGAGATTVSGGSPPGDDGNHDDNDNNGRNDKSKHGGKTDDGQSGGGNSGGGDEDRDPSKSRGDHTGGGATVGGDTMGGATTPGFVASNDTIVGGAGSMTVDGGSADSITGGTGSLLVENVTGSTINAGVGGATVFGGNSDIIGDSVSGPLLVDIESQSSKSSTIAGSGAESVNLATTHGATTLRDISVAGGTGGLAATTVTGFSTTMDFIASKTSVSPAGQFLGTSSVSGGSTVLTFVDGTKITVVGVTDVSKITFTQ